MPHEMIVALRIIFALFVLMIARTAGLLRKEKGGKPMRKRSRKLLRWE